MSHHHFRLAPAGNPKRAQRWAAVTGGNRIRTLRSHIAAAVAHDAAVVSKLPSTNPRRRPTLAQVRWDPGETWLTLEELEEQQAREEQRRRQRLLKRFAIPVTSWDVARAPACGRFWQWSGAPLIVGAFSFEAACPTYWASYVVLPQIRGRS